CMACGLDLLYWPRVTDHAFAARNLAEVAVQFIHHRTNCGIRDGYRGCGRGFGEHHSRLRPPMGHAPATAACNLVGEPGSRLCSGIKSIRFRAFAVTP